MKIQGDGEFFIFIPSSSINSKSCLCRVDVDPMKLAGVISQALCSALSAHLEHLVDSGYQKLALRVTLDPDNAS